MNDLRILALTQYSPLGASSRVRVYQYLPTLVEMGLNVEVASFTKDSYIQSLYGGSGRRLFPVLYGYAGRLRDVLRGRKYDLLWLQRELAPWLPGPVEKLLLASGPPVILDYDDAVFHRYDEHRLAPARALYGRKIDGLMSRADAVVVGNAYLADRAERAGAKRVERIPSVIDLDRYGPYEPPPSDVPFTAGWIGSPSTVPALDAIRPALQRVARELPFRLVIVGADPGWDDAFVDVRPWSAETEVQDLKSVHVGLMPLPDAPWERGKCGFKLIQAMAAGRPVIASPVGANRDIVDPGRTGYLADSEEAWVKALLAYATDSTMREDAGRAARAEVAAHYDLAVTAPQLAALFRDVT